MILRPCLEAGCGALSTRARCIVHAALHRARRNRTPRPLRAVAEPYRKGYDTKEYRTARKAVQEAFRGLPCPVCRQPMHPPTVEHIEPLSVTGGTTVRIGVLCLSCNSGKRGR